MNYIGKWRFHSVGVINESGNLTYMNTEEYINSPMQYIDENDKDAVSEELRERRQMTGACIEVCEDGKLYMLLPIPEGVSQEEVDAAVAAGEVSLRNGMICENPMQWEERDGKLWFDTGIEGEVFGEKADTWVCAIDEEGFFAFMTTRYVKED